MCCCLWRNRNLSNSENHLLICMSHKALYWDHYYFYYISVILQYSCLLMIPAYSYITETPMNFLPLQMIALNNYQNGLLLINYIYSLISPVIVCLGGSVGWGTVRTDRNGLPEGRGSIPGSALRFRVRISGAHALGLISRAGKESSTVSSIICDGWLILS